MFFKSLPGAFLSILFHFAGNERSAQNPTFLSHSLPRSHSPMNMGHSPPLSPLSHSRLAVFPTSPTLTRYSGSDSRFLFRRYVPLLHSVYSVRRTPHVVFLVFLVFPVFPVVVVIPFMGK